MGAKVHVFWLTAKFFGEILSGELGELGGLR